MLQTLRRACKAPHSPGAPFLSILLSSHSPTSWSHSWSTRLLSAPENTGHPSSELCSAWSHDLECLDLCTSWVQFLVRELRIWSHTLRPKKEGQLLQNTELRNVIRVRKGKSKDQQERKRSADQQVLLYGSNIVSWDQRMDNWKVKSQGRGAIVPGRGNNIRTAFAL